MIFLSVLVALVSSATEIKIPVSTAYLNAQTEIIASVCREGSAFRRCKLPEASACQSAADAAFTACYRRDLATRKGSDLSANEAKDLSQWLLDCTVTAPTFRGADALETACYAKAGRSNKSVKIDVSYVKNYQVVETPKAPAPSAKPTLVLDLATRYIVYAKRSVDSLALLRTQLKTNAKAACANYRGSDHTGCALEALKLYPIKTVTDLTLHLVILTAEAARDRQSSGSAESERVLYSSFAALAESVRVDQFWLLTEPATGEYDEMQRRDLAKAENEALAKAKQKINEILNKTGRKPASVEKARERLRAALARPWVLR